MTKKTKGKSDRKSKGQRISLADLADAPEPVRVSTGLSGVDSILGGGLVIGSSVLLSGDTGGGKSTLMLLALANVATGRRRCLYITGEEAAELVVERGRRLGVGKSPRLMVSEKRRLTEILDEIDEARPDVVVIDSIQKVICESPATGEDLFPSSAASVTIATEALHACAHDKKIAIVIIGHVTKDGSIAGPQSGLGHVVDVVLRLDRAPVHKRTLSCSKNRYGDADREVQLNEDFSGPDFIEPEDSEAGDLGVVDHIAPHVAALQSAFKRADEMIKKTDEQLRVQLGDLDVEFWMDQDYQVLGAGMPRSDGVPGWVLGWRRKMTHVRVIDSLTTTEIPADVHFKMMLVSGLGLLPVRVKADDTVVVNGFAAEVLKAPPRVRLEAARALDEFVEALGKRLEEMGKTLETDATVT